MRPKEIVIPLPNRGTLRCGPGHTNRYGGYLRICDHRGRELLRWTSPEWEEDGEKVIGTIFAAASRPLGELKKCIAVSAVVAVTL